jgi:DNA-binding MarR family transcriptional regulator
MDNAQADTGDDIEAVTSAVLTASRLLVAVSARSLAAVEDSVTLPQFRMLVILDGHGPVKLASLAELLAVNPSTALRMVERLLTAGLVDRQVNPEIRREISLQLTESGRRVVADVTSRRREEIARVVTRLEPAQRLALVEALAAFAEAGGEQPVTGIERIPLGWD